MLGAFLNFRSPEVAELMGQCGFDFLILDAEHSSFGPETIQDLVRAIEGTSATPLVRVPEIRPGVVQWALDAGAQGILFPQVRNAQEARTAVSYCLYPPEGTRGLGPGRASDYGVRVREYEAEANQRVLVMIQIENMSAVENLESILDVPGIDLAFLGPGDLSQALGVTGELSHPRVVEVMEKVIQTCAARRIPVGTLALDQSTAELWQRRGVNFLTIGSDSFFLAQKSIAALKEFEKLQAEIHAQVTEPLGGGSR